MKGLGKTFEPAAPGETLESIAVGSQLQYKARQITQPELWCDTSETLTAAHYAFLAKAGYRGAFRYVPLAGGGGGISTAEIQAALATRCPDGSGFSLGFVQYARSNGINAANGTADGAAGAAYLQKLGIPNTVCLFQDLDVGTKASCIDYSNASYAAMVATYLAASAPGMYAEPGYPLSASERYSALHLHRYWATAAADPNRFVASRGCQIVQAWGSSRGEFFPEPGLVIDADLVQADYFASFPVVLTAA